MLDDDRIDISEGIDISKTNASKECDICHHWYLFINFVIYIHIYIYIYIYKLLCHVQKCQNIYQK